jgi:2-polyprenyl-3-methyl-5-hydroxy-6-metoxy-1,4-benzoquinol methylase
MACDHFCKAMDLEPNNQNYHGNFARLISSDLEILSNKNLNKYISLLCRNNNRFNPREISKYFEVRLKNKNSELKTFIHEVAIDDITLAFLQMTPITHYEIEEKFIQSRQFLLQHIEKLTPNENLLRFVNAIAVQCFINEFVWNETTQETQAVLRLEDSIFNQTQKNKQITALKLLLLSCYRPLDSYPASNEQFLIDSLNNYPDVIRIHIEEPSKELLIEEKIPKLTEINNPVSSKVKDQYESNPYPRWIATRLGDSDVDCNILFDTVQLNLDQKPIQFSTEPVILIAGCGTGQHAITSATRFKNSAITAIDLSKSSLSYAIRKSRELDIQNITFYQADILGLVNHQIKYDLIESCGVLHHIEDTFEAWKILAELLKPDGLMKIALYSSNARKEIGVARNIIKRNNLSGTVAEIRKMRREICRSKEFEFKRIRNISKSPDFFTVSECRDLLFHVQERSFTLPEIEVMAGKLGLVFLGFEFINNKAKSLFSKFNPQASPYSLADWHNFETAFPSVFAGMYQMWFKKL